MLVRPYSETDAGKWDDFCVHSFMATFLHTRRFLSYHGDRFRDLSLILEEDGRCVGLLPAALDPGDATHVISHPGITFGGMLHQGALRGARMIEAFEVVSRYFSSLGCNRFTYKVVPHIYHKTPAQDDLYALFRLGAIRSRCDISCAIDLKNRLTASERRRRGARKAAKAGIEIKVGQNYAEAMWFVLEDNLARKHDARPVHSAAEIIQLAQRFPENIQFIVGILRGRVEAGVVLFTASGTCHAQYIAASPAAYEACALDAVFEQCIAASIARGARWFDFGTSNEQGGTVLNEGLYQFKMEFGGGGVAHEFYDMIIS